MQHLPLQVYIGFGLLLDFLKDIKSGCIVYRELIISKIVIALEREAAELRVHVPHKLFHRHSRENRILQVFPVVI